ncbi:hypothetical protein T4A_10795, partial [Trichinella pseudospiralis]
MVHTYMEKLMEQKKVKMRMTRSKSRRALRRTRDEKRLEFTFSKKKAGCTENQFVTLHYANNDHHKGALLSVTVPLFICLNMNNEEEKRRKRGRHKADHRHTKQIADDTKQYKGRQEVYAVPRGSQF